MATLYMDYTNGNNTNAGTSFALRFKDITSGATAARIAPGDVIRIMKSPDPTSLGINGTWTQGSSTITLASALTANISTCESAWTASANVTCTTSSTCKEGSNSASIALAAGFATGKAAYFATGTLDLSAYQQVSFWIRTSSAVANNTTLSLRLCTDTIGAVSVHTIAIPALPMANIWTKVTVDLATNLNSAIQSVALYQDTDRAAVTLLIDNIIACKASSSADSLSLTSLIGKNTANETWYPIASINGTTVRLDVSTNTLPSAQKGYGGSPATGTLYKRETIKTGYAAAASTAIQTVQDSGTAGNPITYSGGWDTTNMSTQDGETWFDGGNGAGIGLTIASRSYITLNKIRFVNYGNAGVAITGTSNNVILDDVACNGNTLDGLLLSASGSGGLYNDLFLCNNGQYGANNSGAQTYTLRSGALVVDGNIGGTGSNVSFLTHCSTGITVPLLRGCCNGGDGLVLASATNCVFTLVYGNFNTGAHGFRINAAVGATFSLLDTGENTNDGLLIYQSDITIELGGASGNGGTGVYVGASNVTMAYHSYSDNGVGLHVDAQDCYIPMISALMINTVGVWLASNRCRIEAVTTPDYNTTLLRITGSDNVIDAIDGDNNTTGVVFGAGGNRNVIKSLILTNTVTTGIDWGYGEGNTILSGSQSGGTQGMLANTGTGVMHSFTISNTTEMGSATPASDYRIASVNHDNTADNHQVFCDGGLISSETTTRHTASGLAWKMSPTSSNRSSTYPLKMSLGLYALASGTVTIKCWMRRTNTGLTVKLVAPINPAAGINTEVSSSMTASADTWEEVSISVSPSSNGVIELEAQCYGGTTYSAYIDDLTVNGVAVPLDYSWNGEPFCSPIVSGAAAMIGAGNLSGGFQ